jgi:hypothetical protein
MRRLSGSLLGIALLAVACGQEPPKSEDRTPWVLWSKIVSTKYTDVETPWGPFQTYEGRARCETAMASAYAENNRGGDRRWTFQCWPTGTAPR